MGEHLLLLARADGGGLVGGDPNERPSFYKGVGIGLAVASGLFIGVSFVLKKVGLLRANDKYNEVAGEGYGYLRNAYWWGGMSLMILGEICNFVAYAFTDAILVTSLGALSVVITTILSAIFLKERLSMVGKVSCFLCIVGSVVIVMNAPHTSAVSDIQEMQKFVITPWFLTYAGVIIVGAVVVVFWVAPKWGAKNMLVYISICSWVGGLSVVATQGLGAALIAWIGGKPQYKEWFFWILFVFVIATLLVEIVYLNKALNLFNAALVTPTYYVYFTSTTIITSAVLFKGFKGTASQMVTVLLGFLTICAGVVLLQLSKAAKDVPDAAVFTGDLDQIHTIAEQEQPETEPKADAIRGAAAIVRRISNARMRMEADELRRLHEEKMLDQMQPINEDGQPQPPEYEWDGLRRRRTTVSRRPITADTARTSSTPHLPRSPVHPPLGMSRFPDIDDDDDDHHDDHDDRSTIFSSIAGSLMRGRGRARTTNTMPTYEEEEFRPSLEQGDRQMSVPLNNVSFNSQSEKSLEPPRTTYQPSLYAQDTAYRGAGAGSSRANNSGSSLKPPTPPPHGGAKRQFSFNRVFRKAESPTEEERAGLVDDGGDTRMSEDQGPGGERRGGAFM
ncbi:DUF803 domain membrane protein [Emericellopsis atlantica]|uniref:DUF803 domain membrane protein n=1 Tax=Emericellopsis atlantica TaxID=2614577 RepID=A0A9P8CNY5_9HYPO|nr:DUF803 domain membrane protein [Emericellopsis atlantica]KAG9254264.1 DUF803 domain membrane protein [Emericellopsis atlantica]